MPDPQETKLTLLMGIEVPVPHWTISGRTRRTTAATGDTGFLTLAIRSASSVAGSLTYNCSSPFNTVTIVEACPPRAALILRNRIYS